MIKKYRIDYYIHNRRLSAYTDDKDKIKAFCEKIKQQFKLTSLYAEAWFWSGRKYYYCFTIQ